MPTDVNWVHTNPKTQFVATAADAPLYRESASAYVWTFLGAFTLRALLES